MTSPIPTNSEVQEISAIVRLHTPGATEADIIRKLRRLYNSNRGIRLLLMDLRGPEICVRGIVPRGQRETYLNHDRAVAANLLIGPFPPGSSEPNPERYWIALNVSFQYIGRDGSVQPGQIQGSHFRVNHPNRPWNIAADMVIGFGLLKKLFGLPAFYNGI